MDNEEIQDKIRELFDRQTVAVLSTRGAEFPHASLVAFVASADLQTIVFPTLFGTRKYDNMARDPRVALTVDDRAGTASDLQHTVVATAFGESRELAMAERDVWRAALLVRHPALRDFTEQRACMLIAVDVRSYDLITDFQSVQTLTFHNRWGANRGRALPKQRQ